MGHLEGKNLYRALGEKIDGLTMRTPWNDALYAILNELYSSDEALVAVKMPYGLATIDKIEKNTGFDNAKLKRILDSMSAKGLMMDLYIGGKYHYILSPMVIGIFEFTMMRTRGNVNYKEWARLFNDYLHGDDSFYRANFSRDNKVSPLRALPYEDSIADIEHIEILDYEKASAILESHKLFSIGICSCRHEKHHLGTKKCDAALETCSTFGPSSAYMVQRGFARKSSKEEMQDNFARSKDLGLVLCADNVKDDVTFVCHCCGCCCNVLLGISELGYPRTVVTSNFIARSDKNTCATCGNCIEACPIHAIASSKDSLPVIDESICIGCGVCGLKCSTGSMQLVRRKARVLHPETTFQRVILQCLERGTLQNLMFAEPDKITHKFMRGMLGAFLKLPPVKKGLMSDTLRSSFLEVMQKGS